MCARRKPDSGCEKSPLQQEISYQPLDRIALDIFGPLNITENGNQYILVVSDWYTTYTVAYALRDHAAVTVANKLVTQFICRFDAPSIIYTDQYPELGFIIFRVSVQVVGDTAPYNPRPDCLSERNIRTIQMLLAMFAIKEEMTEMTTFLLF